MLRLSKAEDRVSQVCGPRCESPERLNDASRDPPPCMRQRPATNCHDGLRKSAQVGVVSLHVLMRRKGPTYIQVRACTVAMDGSNTNRQGRRPPLLRAGSFSSWSHWGSTSCWKSSGRDTQPAKTSSG